MAAPQRYPLAMVVLHWVVAILVALNLALGLIVFRQRGLGAPVPTLVVAVHILAGISILVLVIIRFVLRLRGERPPEASTGVPALDIAQKVVHYGLYVMLIEITAVGLAYALTSNRLQETFFGAQPRLDAAAAYPNPVFGQQPGEPPSGPGRVVPPGLQQAYPNPPLRGGGAFAAIFLLQRIHLVSALVLLSLILLHVAAAVYHQFVRKDGLIGRMWI